MQSDMSENESVVDFGHIETLFLVEDPTKRLQAVDSSQTLRRKKESAEVITRLQNNFILFNL